MIQVSIPKTLIVQLIAEELKVQKVLTVLRELGLEECRYQFHLDRIIVTALGLDPECEKVMECYLRVVENAVRRLRPGKRSAEHEAEKVFRELRWLRLG